jgi:hypothetical protein
MPCPSCPLCSGTPKTRHFTSYKQATDDALLTGWISNLAALGTLGRLLPDCAIFSDALNHNSMIEGIRRSGAEQFIFRHNDAAHLDQLMASVAPERPIIVAFESVYSMDGDVAPTPRSATSRRSTVPSPISMKSMPSVSTARAVAALPSSRALPIVSR